MSFNGSGSFLINTAGQPVVSGTVISSTAFNALTADLATGLSTCITKDGQTTVTANLPMAGYKFTGLGTGSAAGDSPNLSQVQSTVVKLLASVSGADTITAVGSPTVAAYAAGQMFYFVAAGTNTGAVTLNIDSLGAKAVTRDGSTALIAGDIQSGEVCVVVYDGTRFQLINAANAFGNITVTGVASFADGSASDPSITNTGDLNTGIFFPAADTVGVSTGGSERLRVDASGNLGLGVTPSSWGTNYKAIESSAASTVAITGANVNGVSLVSNAYATNSDWVYKTTGTAAYYNVSANNHLWYVAPSGTAGNAITFTQAMTLDASGNLGVGTTSPSSRIHAEGAGVTIRMKTTGAIGSGSTCFLQYDDSAGDSGYVGFGGTANTFDIYNRKNGAMTFGTNNTERARITGGGVLLVGATSNFGAADDRLQVDTATASARSGIFRNNTSATDTVGVWNSATTGDNLFIQFYTEAGASVRGNITYNRGANQVAYNVTSDVRLKDNIADAVDSGSKVDALKVRQFDWKETGNHVDYGFVAQELDAVVPNAVSKPEDDEAMWSVDYSKLVPMLVKEIQSLRARVAALEGA